MKLNRLSLNVVGLNRIGLNRIGSPSRGSSSGSDRSYIDPEVLASLKAVCICYGKSNDDPDRAIIKNLVDPDNPFVISNAAFKLNSGFGKYSADFESFDWTIGISQKQHNKASISLNGRLCNHAAIEVEEMKVNIIGNVTELIYWYIANPDDTARSEIRLTSGINTLPKSYAKEDGQTYNIGFAYISGDNEITIEQIPSFEGAFVTDGIDDLITSTKTVQEMLGGSNEITVVSMVHQVKDTANNVSFTNYIRGSANGYFRNIVNNYGKTGIYGYTSSDLRSLLVINNILGDKNDYTSNGDNRDTIINGNFSVQGYSYNNSNNTGDFSSVAWYWTVIANKGLTTDQINQVIAYFNLDRTLKPDILCDVKKQGITNENHAEFGDKLIDFSGNGRDIQMNNLAWKGGSGIAAKQFETLNDWILDNKDIEFVKHSEFSYTISGLRLNYWRVRVNNSVYDNSKTIKITVSAECQWFGDLHYRLEGDTSDRIKTKYVNLQPNVIAEVPVYCYSDFDEIEGATYLSCSSYVRPLADNVEITVTITPSCEGGLITDGVNDFGKVTGLPAYKDYTTIIDYQRFDIGYIEGKSTPGILSKAHAAGQGAFLMNLIGSTGTYMNSYSFGTANANTYADLDRQIYYQTKYKMQGFDMTAGTGVDGDSMWLALVRDNDSRFFNGVFYSLLMFPYSMSEFLIERQLKKHKLGTLYPDMVEFRPIVNSNVEWNTIEIWQADKPLYRPAIGTNETGTYLQKDSTIGIYVKPKGVDEVTKIVVNGTEYTNLKINSNGFYYVTLPITKSPQKIDITIDEYIRYEDIVQPYPVIFKVRDRNTNQVYSWGDKIKLGSSIQLFQEEYSNLLNGAYRINSYEYEGNSYSYNALNNLVIILTKPISISCNKTWLLDNNEPKVILSPSRLRIPNSSYKILGYIPDISGHGNHGVIHNSAYAEGSGVNEDGSYQFDGVNDFVTIPTLFSGGKQVLMKVNWDKTIADAILYDQRGYPNEFAIYNADVDNNNNPVFAYQARNNGQTYIDGILNKNIKASELRAITHNITITNELSTGTNTSSPVIGSNRVHDAYFTNMALYDFMLFDEISTEDKIKELNEYVGIEAKVELPPYYWDAYGKTNLDGDKATIQQRGVAVGDYDLTNNNLAYEGMSGYNGYPVVFGTNKTYANLVPNNGNFILTSSHNIINVTKFDTSYGLLYSHIKLDGKLTSRNIDYPSYKIKVTGLGENFGLHYSYLESSSDTTVKGFEINNDGIYIIPKSFASDGSLTSNSDWIGFIFTGTAPESCNVTIEMLPLYPNGLVYDGITDYSMNTNIPALTDYTYILKRQILKGIANSAVMYKGNVTVNRGGAFICNYCEPSDTNLFADLSFGGLLRSNDIDKPIIYGTKTSVNGDSITPGENIDTVGINVGKWVNYLPMVFYKLILYPKTIPLLQINFLKNLMERDEIIDLNNPIFVQE